MTCPQCKQENPPSAKFCNGCGAALELRCGGCGHANPASSRFCNECGQPLGRGVSPVSRFASLQAYTPKRLVDRILTSKAALVGERKLVTVLFADMKGSTELLADRDPEEARKILDPVLEHMIEAVHRFEGTVNQVMGDGIMALFGAPLAHEDHAVRACYAALRMQESVQRYRDAIRRIEGVPIRIRVGLNSGEVVVRAIGSDLHMDYTAVGATTHLAARMEQIADAGTVLLTPHTLSLAEGFVEVKSLGPTAVKGLAETVEVYELLRVNAARSRLQAMAARGLTAFVGRSAEMSQLNDALELARGGKGQILAVVGEPGVGKSRLLWEFTHSHRTGGCLVVEAASVSYGKSTAYFPVIELLKTYFGIEPSDDARRIREKVTGKLLSLDRALEPSIAALLSLLEVPLEDVEWTRLDPPLRRQRTLDGLKRLLLRESQLQPVLLVFEDLHWIDGETQALLDMLVESLPSARLLLLVNYRPEYQHGWGGKTYYRQVRLDALSSSNAAELLDSLLGREPGIEPLKRLLIARTEGNPFFIEEIVRSLVDAGALIGHRGAYQRTGPVETLTVPATAQAVLSARIDRLEPEDKRRLQAAAVIGKDVPFSLLQAISDEAEDDLRAGLARLQAAEFLYEARLFPELEYTFKHALTHEVAYRGLLHEVRRELHARIVAAIETLHSDRLGEHTERLAEHALRGELADKALRYLRQAGMKAAARSALQDARACFEQALTVTENLPKTPLVLQEACDIRLEMRPVLIQLGKIHRMLGHLREAEKLAEQINDELRQGRVCANLTNVHSILGQLDEALASGNRAVEIARRLGDIKLRIGSTTYLIQAHYCRSEYERVANLAAENLASIPLELLYEFLGVSAPPSIYDRVWLIMSLAELGRFDEAAAHEVEAIRLADLSHHPFSIGRVRHAAGVAHLLKGNWAGARALIEHSVQVFEQAKIILQVPYAVADLAWALAQVGDSAEAGRRLAEGEILMERHLARAIVGITGWAFQALGRAAFLLGRSDDARRLGQRAIVLSPRHPGFVAHALHLLADIEAAPQSFEPASSEARYAEAMAIARERGMRPLVAHCHAGLAKLHRRKGNGTESEREVSSACAMYRDLGMTFWLGRTEQELREIA
jgi:class 3 adenylate cyclase/tetratricopeptide (TPR) repeat protein